MEYMRKKLSVEEQINHMKAKGIKFNIINELDATNYLTNNTYYFKLKAYAKNYDVYRIGELKGQYVNLEFAYLKDLSIIDKYLRHYILTASVDLEHSIKVRFLNDFNHSNDNGYDLVEKYLHENPDVLNEIKLKSNNTYVADLTNKLQKDGFAIWNIIELLSLADFLKLYKRFYEEYPEALTGPNLYYPMQAVRKLRNASAHSNCLVNSLRKPYSGDIKYNGKVDSFIGSINTIDRLSKKNNRNNQVVYDFVTMLYLINTVMNADSKARLFSELHDLFNGRILLHADYYKKENIINSTFLFVNKIVDYLYQTTI